MTFYALHEGFYEGVQTRLELLKEACAGKGIAFVAIDSTLFDYTAIPKLDQTDLLYNFARGSQTLESLLLTEQVTTFYRKNPPLNSIRSMTEFSIVHDKIGLPAPKTIYHLPTHRELLQQYVAHLGGFPIVLKVTGGTRGVGTIKLDNWPSLYSTADYLATTGDSFIMRQFIDASFGARIMVLGDKVILSTKFFFQENDFRNAPILSATRYEPMTISDEVAAMCIRAVHAVNLDMAGVDVLFDKQNRPYLLEINFPTGFQSFRHDPQPILAQWLDYLIQKSTRHER